MEEQDYREVHFHVYCEKCKHKDLKETDRPCDECLDNPLNQFTDKPTKFEEK